MRIPHLIGGLGLMGILGACDNICKPGEVRTVVKTEYVSAEKRWHASLKDTILDGAIRIETWAIERGRGLDLRCFKGANPSSLQQLDIRYSIRAPLLSKVVPDLLKGGPIVLVVSIDGDTIGTVNVRPVANEESLGFLGDLSDQLLNRIVSAKKSIVVMPRQGAQKLDDVIEFGVGELTKHIEPVKKACERAATEEQQPVAATPTTNTSATPEVAPPPTPGAKRR